MIEAINRIDLAVLSVSLKAEVTREIRWNSFPGSVIHGIIGFHLKELSCVVKHRNCKKCYLSHFCAHGMIYESPMPSDSKRMKLYPQTPHPIRIIVYPWDRTCLVEGEEFEIGISLYGRAVANHLMIMMSLEKALKEGIGRVHRGERGTARILSLRDGISGDSTNWAHLKTNYQNVACPKPLGEIADGASPKNIGLSVRSPLKIVVNGRVSFKPDLRDITSNLLRRLGNLSFFFGENELELDHKGILAEAERTLIESRLKRVEAIRYSSRQEKTISLSGVVGEMHFRNCPPAISKLLHMGQFTGLGKGTTMGLGDYGLKMQ
jgi:hypothetical protein